MLYRQLLAGFIFTALPLVTNAQARNCFVIGSSKGEVRKVHGAPSSIYKSEGKETWSYGKSTISFKDEVVSEYDNYGKNLKVCKEVVAVVSKDEQERLGYLQPARSKSKATKAATQDWILEKLNKYVDKSVFIEGYYSHVSGTQYPGKTLKNTNFSIEGTTLVVTVDVDDPRDPHQESYSIPIQDMKRIYSEGDKLILTCKSSSISHKIGRQVDKDNNLAVKYDINGEADLKSRLVSAFSHLQKLYKTPQKKETF